MCYKAIRLLTYLLKNDYDYKWTIIYIHLLMCKYLTITLGKIVVEWQIWMKRGWGGNVQMVGNSSKVQIPKNPYLELHHRIILLNILF